MDGQGKRQGVGLLSWETIRPYEEDPAPGTSAYLLVCGVRLLWPLVPVLSLWSRCPLHSQCRELRQVLKLTTTEGTTQAPSVRTVQPRSTDDQGPSWKVTGLEGARREAAAA